MTDEMSENTETPENQNIEHDDVLSLVLHIRANLDKDIIVSHEMTSNQLVLRVRADNLLKLVQFLRDDKLCYFKQLIDITGVDYPERFNDGGRFDVVYQLLSLKYNRRLRLKVQTDEATPVPSVTAIYSTANWFEREVFDMYGIMFAGHPDHRRILTDYGFDGHPLRKDFPLTGHVEVRWDEGQKKVVYEPVSLTQDYRVFDNLSPWEGMTDVQLPGDEKAVKPKYGGGQ